MEFLWGSTPSAEKIGERLSPISPLGHSPLENRWLKPVRATGNLTATNEMPPLDLTKLLRAPDTSSCLYAKISVAATKAALDVTPTEVPMNVPFRSVIVFFLTVLTTSIAYAQAGQLDTTFATNGIFSDTFSGATGAASAVLLQADGKILAAGQFGSTNSTTGRGVVVRLNTDGSLDTTFGTAGVVSIKFGAFNNILTGIALQTDGKMVVAGSALAGGSGLITRLNADGSIDTGFGTSGFVSLYPVTPGPVALLTDGKIILLGLNPNGTNTVGFPQMARYNSNGTLDTTFGNDGQAPIVFAGSSIHVLTNGKFLITSGGIGVGTVARYNSNGTLDTTFGILGQQSALAAPGIALQSNGQIVTAGSISTQAQPTGTSSGFGLMRFGSSGTVDPTFGTRGGVVTSFPSLPNASALPLVIQSNGDIVAAGIASSGSSGSFALARYLSNGKLDTTFGTGGLVITNLGSGTAAVSALAIQSDGKIVAAGSASSGEFVVARYLAQ